MDKPIRELMDEVTAEHKLDEAVAKAIEYSGEGPGGERYDGFVRIVFFLAKLKRQGYEVILIDRPTGATPHGAEERET